jgi:hypothetical protein
MALQDFAQADITQAYRETGDAKGHKQQIEHGKPSRMRASICAEGHSGSTEEGRASYRKVIGIRPSFVNKRSKKLHPVCRPA